MNKLGIKKINFLKNLKTAMLILSIPGLASIIILLIISPYVMPLLPSSYTSAVLNHNAELMIPDVKELTISLTEICGSDICRAKRISEFVKDNIKYSAEHNKNAGNELINFEDSLENGGDCKTFSVIFTAMARAVNMTARVVSTKGSTNSHSLVLAVIGNNNYLVDVQRSLFQETIIKEYLI